MKKYLNINGILQVVDTDSTDAELAKASGGKVLSKKEYAAIFSKRQKVTEPYLHFEGSEVLLDNDETIIEVVRRGLQKGKLRVVGTTNGITRFSMKREDYDDLSKETKKIADKYKV